MADINVAIETSTLAISTTANTVTVETQSAATSISEATQAQVDAGTATGIYINPLTAKNHDYSESKTFSTEITCDNKEGSYSTASTGNKTFTAAGSGHVNFGFHRVLVPAISGRTIGFTGMVLMGTNGYTASYDCYIYFWKDPATSSLCYSVIASDATTDVTAPTISSGTMDTDSNDYVDIVISEGIYGANDGSTPAALADFTVTFTKGAGTATNWTASSAKQNDSETEGSASALAGGETTVRIFGSPTGTPNGSETITITPADGASLYDAAGNAMAAGQTTGAVNLYNAGGGYEAESNALFARMATAGSEPDATRKGHINTLIAGLKSDGNWAKLDSFIILAAHAASCSVLNWTEDDHNCIAQNSPTFTTDRGYTFNGTTQYLTTDYVPSVDANNVTQNSLTAGAFIRTAPSGGTNNALFGSVRNTSSPNTAIRVYQNDPSNILAFQLNDFTAVSYSESDGIFDANSLYSIQRTGAAAVSLYKNSSQLQTGTTASVALPSLEMYIAANNVESLGTPGQYISGQFMAWYIGAGTINISQVYTRLVTFLTAIGAL